MSPLRLRKDLNLENYFGVVPICKVLPDIEQRDTLFNELENHVVEKTRSASLQNVVNLATKRKLHRYVKQPSLFQVVVTMSDVWRICVIGDEEVLNQNLVNALRNEGHNVQGVTREADAIHVLWSEEFDIVIYDLKAPEDDSFELLQWLRAYRPNMYMITVGAANSPALRAHALETGAVSYLEKPLDFRALKDELRRLSQNSGFTASLDSFDLLDVIQIINMSRKDIALLINTGLEEHGTLGFQNGELIWAEYGILHGEEAFFALAAHKNGTVTQQFLDEQVVANVTQPLSRLIFQALQYRTKYADRQPQGGEQEEFTPNAIVGFSVGDVDDRPFVFSAEEQTQVPVTPVYNVPDDLLLPTSHLEMVEFMNQTNDVVKEWWQHTGQIERLRNDAGPRLDASAAPTSAMDALMSGTGKAKSNDESDVPTNSPVELPSWLTDQPTSQSMPVMQSPAFSIPDISATSVPSEWQSAIEIPEDLSPNWSEFSQQLPVYELEAPFSSSPSWPSLESSSLQGTEPPPSTPVLWESEFVEQSGPLPASNNGAYGGQNGSATHVGSSGSGFFDTLQDSNPLLSTSSLKAQRLAAKRNYAALVSALQTLGYSIVGFIAAAVVSIDGHPVAQVAVDDLDISNVCRYFSTIQKNALQALGDPKEDNYEETVITSSTRHILMRIVDTDKKAFLVLITTREASPMESLEVMANVEGAISAALR
jgi:DNA-binding response OmpR family regulator/predicted regulator of Ras-like GTPase activity (Roadblock/LC7/MglB family)